MTNIIIEAGGLLRATSAAELEEVLRRQAGIHDLEANPVSQTMTVHSDQPVAAPDDIRAWIQRFSYTRGGEVVPCHFCRDEQRAVLGSTGAHGADHPPQAGPAMSTVVPPAGPRLTTRTPATQREHLRLPPAPGSSATS